MKKIAIRPNPLPSIADLFFVMILTALFFCGKSTLLGDCDTGYHIRAGDYIIRTLSVPKYDIFSQHQPPIPWTAHEWLAEAIMAAIHARFGLSGVVAFYATLLALTAYLLFKILRSYRHDVVVTAAITTLVVSVSQVHWLARPHLFSFLLMVVCHHLLESWHRGLSDRLYLLPPIMLFWVNLHGGFVGAFILLGAYLAGYATKIVSAPAGRAAARAKLYRLALVTTASLAACLVNPRGYQILLFPFKLVSDTYIMDHVSEFLSPDFHLGLGFKYLLLLLVVVFAISRKTLEATELVLALVFTNMALYSVRYIPLFALVTAPILTRKADEARELLGERLGSMLERRSRNVAAIDDRAKGHLWPCLALLVVALAVYSGRFPHTFDPKLKAVAACEFLMKEKITGNVFNNDEIGDYMIYRCAPAYKVFCDGRSDMYGAARLKEYARIVNFEAGWEEILDKYRVTWIIFDSKSAFSRYLLQQKNWVLIYSDKVANIFVRDLPQYRPLIRKYRGVQPVVS